MLSFVLAALLVAQSPGDVSARRAAAERFLEIRTGSCPTAATAAVEQWPAGEAVTVKAEVFFVQSVDDELVQEQLRTVRALLDAVLQPLGVTPKLDDPKARATIAFIGIAEALPPPGERRSNAFDGTWWRGSLSLHLPVKCVFVQRFESRTQASGASFIDEVADVPFLEGLEPALIGVLIQTAEAIRGQAGLARIATSDADSRICLQAVARITDQGMLIGLARTAKASWVRVPAVAKLVDVNRLENIAKGDRSAEVRQAALARIAELKKN